MNIQNISYVWIFFFEKILDKAKEFKNTKKDYKDLTIFEIITQKFELHDFIVNSETSYLYLENLIKDALNQNQIPHNVFIQTFTADCDIDYNKDLGLNFKTQEEAKKHLNSEILKLFTENGKFCTQLKDFFESVKKNPNIKFISFDQAKKNILNEFKKNKNNLLNEDGINALEEELQEIEKSFFNAPNPPKYTRDNIFYGNLRFIQYKIENKTQTSDILEVIQKSKLKKDFKNLYEFLKYFNDPKIKNNLEEEHILLKAIISELYTELSELLNKMKEDKDYLTEFYNNYLFDKISKKFTLEELIKDFYIKNKTQNNHNLNKENSKTFLIDTLKIIAIFYSNFTLKQNCLFTDFDTESKNLKINLNNQKYPQFSILNYKDLIQHCESRKIKFSKEVYQDYLNKIELCYGNICHLGLLYSPIASQKLFLFLIKNFSIFKKTPFLIKKERSEFYIELFAQHIEWILDDFVCFIDKNPEILEKFEEIPYYEFDQKFKDFIETKYKNAELTQVTSFNLKFFQKLLIESFYAHFYSENFTKIHLFSDYKKQNYNNIIQGKTGESYNKETEEIKTKNIKEFFNDHKSKYDKIVKNISLTKTTQITHNQKEKQNQSKS